MRCRDAYADRCRGCQIKANGQSLPAVSWMHLRLQIDEPDPEGYESFAAGMYAVVGLFASQELSSSSRRRVFRTACPSPSLLKYA